jgi:hypothetical protein
MADNVRVLDCRVDELAANLNAITEHFGPVVWNFYDRGAERRVTVVMGKIQPQVMATPTGLFTDPRRRN